MNPIRVLVVDDHPVVRRGLRDLIATSGDLEVVGEAAGSSAALDQCKILMPDVILLDIRLKGHEGLDLVPQIRQLSPDSRVIMLTSYDDEQYLTRALANGAYGYLLKSTADMMLVDAIRQVYAGAKMVTPSLMNKVLDKFAALSKADAIYQSGLEPEEIQTLQLMAQGATNREIAEKLFLSERTIKRRVRDIMGKLELNSRAELVTEATRRGII
jgi:two-component system, NarL family, response regulator DevR